MSHPNSLIDAAASANVTAAQRLIRSGVNVDEVDGKGFTALMHAAFLGHAELMTILLDAGANQNAKTPSGTTALLLAVEEGRLECIRILLNRGASHSLTTALLPLHHAVARGQGGALQALLEAGADPNGFDARGRTPLHEAARLGSQGAVSFLLQYGADPSLLSTDDLGWSAWCFAKQAGHARVAFPLRQLGINASISVRLGRSSVAWKLRLGAVLKRFLLSKSAVRVVEGIPVHILPKAIREPGYSLIEKALQLIMAHSPAGLRGIQSRLARIWVPGPHQGVGGYDWQLSTCILDSRYLLSPNTLPVAVAGTLVHESTHARLWTSEYNSSVFVRARTERMCYEAQWEFLVRAQAPPSLIQSIEIQRDADPTWYASKELARQRQAWLKIKNLR